MGSLSQERKGLHEQNVFVVIIIKKKHQKRLRIALLTEQERYDMENITRFTGQN